MYAHHHKPDEDPPPLDRHHGEEEEDEMKQKSQNLISKEGSTTPDQVERDPVEHLQRGRAQEPQHQEDDGHADRLILSYFPL